MMVRARALSNRIPTKWLFTGVAGIALAISAAFGGLADAPVPPLPTLKAGEAFTGVQLSIAIDRVVLIDAFPEQFIEPAEGYRLLVVVATVENVWDRPVSTLSGVGAADNIRPRGIKGIDADTPPARVDVLSDATSSPTLQSGVPIELAYMWEVPEDVLADGDELQLDIYDKVYAVGSFVTYGERFGDPFVAAVATLGIEDVGAGNSGTAE
ncbi:MAG: hypothetical protein JWQ43_2144 [Glaciihabitans sp.]|nr:hypothetical protein [Glaciihabitans sp.]